MYLRQLRVENCGPLTDLSLEFPVENGRPLPILLVGGNGSGKTTALSIITDALFEGAATAFSDVLPTSGEGRQWFRVVGGETISVGAGGSCAVLRFDHDGSDYFFTEKAGKLLAEDVRSRSDLRLHPGMVWSEEGVTKKFSLHPISKAIFREGVYAYFPSSRAERPNWLNEESVSRQQFHFKPHYENLLEKPIFVEQGIDKLSQWLLSVLIDKRVDFLMTQGPTGAPIPIVAGDAQRSMGAVSLWASALRIARIVLDDNSAKIVWLGRDSSSGIGYQVNERAMPLSALSAGQATLLNIFGTLLRYASYRKDLIATSEVSGICIIDEIDAHMHVDLQSRALPELISMFPKVQFIVSSHSPLFVLGMERKIGRDCLRVLEMPSGRALDAEAYSEFERALQLIQSTQAFSRAVEEAAGVGERMLVFLEGETDPKYMEAACMLLGYESLLDQAEFVWIGAKDARGQGFNTGKDGLNSALNFFRANRGVIKRKVVLVYDHDVNKPMSDEGLLFVRSMPKRMDNKVLESGIENLLPDEVFVDEIFERNTKKKPDGSVLHTTSINKMRLCKNVCEIRKSATDFHAFAPILDELGELLRQAEKRQ
jgi:hypothetical protein